MPCLWLCGIIAADIIISCLMKFSTYDFVWYSRTQVGLLTDISHLLFPAMERKWIEWLNVLIRKIFPLIFSWKLYWDLNNSFSFSPKEKRNPNGSSSFNLELFYASGSTPWRCCASQNPWWAQHGLSLAFQLTEVKAKLEVSERRVSELELERHRQHPEEERWRALGRERLLQEKVGECPVVPLLCSVVSSLLPFVFLPLCEAQRGLCTAQRWDCGSSIFYPRQRLLSCLITGLCIEKESFQYDWQTAQP